MDGWMVLVLGLHVKWHDPRKTLTIHDNYKNEYLLKKITTRPYAYIVVMGMTIKFGFKLKCLPATPFDSYYKSVCQRPVLLNISRLIKCNIK